jgi:hypothetical protein
MAPLKFIALALYAFYSVSSVDIDDSKIVDNAKE